MAGQMRGGGIPLNGLTGQNPELYAPDIAAERVAAGAKDGLLEVAQL